jgi:hypothetical protein
MDIGFWDVCSARGKKPARTPLTFLPSLFLPRVWKWELELKYLFGIKRQGDKKENNKTEEAWILMLWISLSFLNFLIVMYMRKKSIPLTLHLCCLQPNLNLTATHLRGVALNKENRSIYCFMMTGFFFFFLKHQTG